MYSLMCSITRCISPYQTAVLSRWGHCGVECAMFLMRQNIKMLMSLILRSPGRKRCLSCRPWLDASFDKSVFCCIVQSIVIWTCFISLWSRAVAPAFLLQGSTFMALEEFLHGASFYSKARAFCYKCYRAISRSSFKSKV